MEEGFPRELSSRLAIVGIKMSNGIESNIHSSFVDLFETSLSIACDEPTMTMGLLPSVVRNHPFFALLV